MGYFNFWFKFVGMGMKVFSILAVSAVVFFTSCEEEPPVIKFTEKPLLDTTYYGSAPAAQQKKVLLSDITGVRCNNCPRAAETAKKIYTDNNGRVELIALYPNAGTLTFPWADNDTLNTTDADQLIGVKPSSLPKGMVDNVESNGNVLIDELGWNLAVTQRLAVQTPVNIELSAKWISSEDRGRIEIKAIANQVFNSGTSWVIAILEDEIIGKQSDARVGGENEDYEHNHVLRKVIGSPFGDKVADAFDKAGYTREKHYYVPRNKKWKAENLHCMVWVMNSATKEVYQVKSVKFTP